MKKYDIKNLDSYWLNKYAIAAINQDRYNSLKEIVFSEWPDISTAKNNASEFTVAIWKVKLKSKCSINWKPVDTSEFNYNLN